MAFIFRGVLIAQVLLVGCTPLPGGPRTYTSLLLDGYFSAPMKLLYYNLPLYTYTIYVIIYLSAGRLAWFMKIWRIRDMSNPREP